jgi:hypothetical protein
VSTFVEGTQQVGKQGTYKDPDRVYDILKAARAPQEDFQAVEYALEERRPGSVELKLTEDQHRKLTRGGISTGRQSYNESSCVFAARRKGGFDGT